ncbi:sigma factor RpoD [Seminavis robusta]|uniref:Sigma factor RpoD n=1 Tax=Seminavis robusta TaxID=568900 RepID=A0A9N8ERU2_9STRA|nr:sigma factor RpoD [Seminavis robusta]|eukprot:Sro1763_g296010.1 sigma factor RpoD (425) ;mRNA; f:16908-18255
MRRNLQRRLQQDATISSSNQTQHPRRQQKSILDDGYGHVNPDLAATLWQWEQQHRENAKLPKVSFSTRQGLRLVDDIVTEITTSPRGKRLFHDDNDIRTDLVQEGIMALMDALNEYRRQQQSNFENFDEDEEEQGEESSGIHNMHTSADTADPNVQFEAFARPYLQDRLWSSLDKTARPVQLPETESIVWQYIEKIRPQLRAELGGRDPTAKELADRLNLPPKTLESLLASQRGVLSMESTVEIKTPESLEDQTAHFTDYEAWEAREGHLLNNNNNDKNKEEVLVEEFQDEEESYQYEGEDEMWIHQTQIAAPLRDIIPDGGPSPDDVALSDMIRHDVGKFLSKTLSPEEVKVVRMVFGLDAAGKAESPLTIWEEIGYPMNMQPLEVKQVLRGAVRKLRMAYRSNYVESYLDEEADLFDDAESV